MGLNLTRTGRGLLVCFVFFLFVIPPAVNLLVSTPCALSRALKIPCYLEIVERVWKTNLSQRLAQALGVSPPTVTAVLRCHTLRPSRHEKVLSATKPFLIKRTRQSQVVQHKAESSQDFILRWSKLSSATFVVTRRNFQITRNLVTWHWSKLAQLQTIKRSDHFSHNILTL